jgi:hypothetical protein
VETINQIEIEREREREKKNKTIVATRKKNNMTSKFSSHWISSHR